VELNDETEAVFEKALADDPRDRYSSIEDFWTALEPAEGFSSSFARARRRRQDPTYDDEHSEHIPPQQRGSDEFDLELDGDELEFELPSSVPPPPIAAHGYDQSTDSLPGLDSIPPAAVSSKSSAGEFFLETSSAPPASSNPPPGSFETFDSAPPNSFDLDLGQPDDSEPVVHKPRIALTSGSFQKPELNESGSFPAARDPSPSLRARGTVGVQAAVEETSGLMAQLRTPIIFVAVGLGLTILDMILSRAMGGTLSLGPVRLRWIAVVLAGVGMLLAFWNLLGDKDE
jgi:serine/threonine-protein kinase